MKFLTWRKHSNLGWWCTIWEGLARRPLGKANNKPTDNRHLCWKSVGLFVLLSILVRWLFPNRWRRWRRMQTTLALACLNSYHNLLRTSITVFLFRLLLVHIFLSNVIPSWNVEFNAIMLLITLRELWQPLTAEFTRIRITKDGFVNSRNEML